MISISGRVHGLAAVAVALFALAIPAYAVGDYKAADLYPLIGIVLLAFYMLSKGDQRQ